MKIKININKLVYFVSFFTFAGYQAGLALIISTGQVQFSRYYSIPLRTILMILMVIIIINNRNNGKKLFNKVYLPFMMLFAVFYIIKVIITESNSGSFLSRHWYEYIFYFLGYSITPFFAFAFINFEKYKKIILNAFISSGFVLGLLSLYLYKDILVMGLGRISMIQYDFPNRATLSPLALSYSAVLTIVLCIYRLVYVRVHDFKTRIYIYITIILSSIMFFLGASRGSLVAVLLCIPFLIYYGSFKNKIRVILLSILAIPLILYGVQITGSAIFTRSENTIETGDASGRQELWAAAYKEFINNPIVGGRIEVSDVYPHNVFLEVLMSTGIIGACLFFTVFFKSLARGLIIIKNKESYLISILIFINGISESMFSGSIYGAILLFTPMGMIYSSYISRNFKKNKAEFNGHFSLLKK